MDLITTPTLPRPPAGSTPQPLDTTAVEVDHVLEVRGLTKHYRREEVLRGVSFHVRRGELYGLLGTNGAGKTTTVEILQGLRAASGGEVRVLGLDPGNDGDELRRRVGSQLQDAALPDRIKVAEALRLMARLHPAPRPLDELVAEWRLDHLLRRPFGALSGGERQRLFVALALVGQPELVFLDELTQNLDPMSRRHTWDVVRQIRDRGTTVVLVTHDVEEAEQLCDRVAVLHGGRVAAEGSPAEIVEALGGRASVRFTDAELDVRSLRDVPGVREVRRHGPEVEVVGDGPLLAHVGARMVSEGRPPLDLRVQRPTLVDRFVELTGSNPHTSDGDGAATLEDQR